MAEEAQVVATQTTAKGGVGCGTLIAFLIVGLILIAIGGNAVFGYYLDHCEEEDMFECLMGALEGQEEEEAPEGSVTAVGPYNYKDYSVSVTMNIPLEGGGVTGNMSGTCSGQVKGSFDGQKNGVISGTITGSCSPFIVNIPASADFSGTVNKDGKIVPIRFTGKGAGFTHVDSMSLSY